MISRWNLRGSESFILSFVFYQQDEILQVLNAAEHSYAIGTEGPDNAAVPWFYEL